MQSQTPLPLSFCISQIKHPQLGQVCVQPAKTNHAWEHAAWDNEDNESSPFPRHFSFCLFVISVLSFLFAPSIFISLSILLSIPPPCPHPSPQLSPSLYVIINREASYLRPGHCLSPAHVWRNCALLQPPSGSLLFLVLLPLLCLCSRGSLRLRLSSWAETLTRPPTKRARQSAEAGDAAACRLCPCRGSAAYP